MRCFMALGVLVVMAAPARAGMEAPSSVRAEVGGHFRYEWVYVADHALTLAGSGWSDVDNTAGQLHGDCFCFPDFCSMDAGDTLRWLVEGTLVDTTRSGAARNWVAPCDEYSESLITEIVPATTAVPDPPAGTLTLSSRPNPCTDRTVFHYSLPASGTVELAIYDLSGRRIATAASGEAAAGAHAASWDAPRAGATRKGVYFARLTFAGRMSARRVLVVR